MKKQEPEEKQQSQSSDDIIKRIEKRQIEREIVRQLSTRMLMLATLIVLIVPLTVWVVSMGKPEVKKPSSELRAKASEIKPATTATTSIKAVTATTLNPAAFQQESTETIFLIGIGNIAYTQSIIDKIKIEGPQEPFSNIQSILKSADIVVGNLESPFIPEDKVPPIDKPALCGIPKAALGMKSAGINLVSLANDHIMDFGTEGLTTTASSLKQAQVGYAGAGNNFEEAYTRTMLDIKGKKIAFLAFSSIVLYKTYATNSRPGIASTQFKSHIESVIKEAADESDYLIVSYHWGDENLNYVQKYQRRLAQRAVDLGADIVIGSHPHNFQGIELYNGRPIAYSLGDFIATPETRDYKESFMFKLSLAKGMVINAEIVPIMIDPAGKPDVITGCGATSILTKLKELSKPYGTVVDVKENMAQVH